jgi:uncharacterized protein (TIGR01777 family)
MDQVPSPKSQASSPKPSLEFFVKIAVTGSTGLVGTALVESMQRGGHTVARIVRNRPVGESPDAERIAWSVESQAIEAAKLEGLDAVVHLAGESVMGRWTDEKKRRIRSSRVDGTTLLARAIAGLRRPPRVLLSASAIGIYGDRGDAAVDETAEAGGGFLGDVARQWEQATEVAETVGVRVVRMRIGIVLTRRGGALKMMLTPFKLGVGGVVGPGTQYMSWIHLDDMVGAIHHCLASERLSGPVNFTAPEPVTNRELTKTLGHVLSRPTVLPVPAFALKLAFGEMGGELLASTRVIPRRLLDSGYRFKHPTLESALRAEVGG